MNTKHRGRIPQWLLQLVIAAVFSVVGFFGRDLYVDMRKKAAAKDAALEHLERFQNLVEQSTSSFMNQHYLAQRLMGLLVAAYGTEVPVESGYDEAFHRFHDRMNADQLELFSLIRGTTEHSMHELNRQLLDWANSYSGRGLSGRSSPRVTSFDAELDTLRVHLNLWFDKYESVFKPDSRRSLVYLGDEKGHGVKFPGGLRASIRDLLVEMKGGPSHAAVKAVRPSRLVLRDSRGIRSDQERDWTWPCPPLHLTMGRSADNQAIPFCRRGLSLREVA